jgi:hypothetical protein
MYWPRGQPRSLLHIRFVVVVGSLFVYVPGGQALSVVLHSGGLSMASTVPRDWKVPAGHWCQCCVTGHTVPSVPIFTDVPP